MLADRVRRAVLVVLVVARRRDQRPGHAGHVRDAAVVDPVPHARRAVLAVLLQLLAPALQAVDVADEVVAEQAVHRAEDGRALRHGVEVVAEDALLLDRELRLDGRLRRRRVLSISAASRCWLVISPRAAVAMERRASPLDLG